MTRLGRRVGKSMSSLEVKTFGVLISVPKASTIFQPKLGVPLENACTPGVTLMRSQQYSGNGPEVSQPVPSASGAWPSGVPRTSLPALEAPAAVQLAPVPVAVQVAPVSVQSF